MKIYNSMVIYKETTHLLPEVGITCVSHDYCIFMNTTYDNNPKTTSLQKKLYTTPSKEQQIATLKMEINSLNACIYVITSPQIC